MIDIALQGIEKYYGANHVLKGVNFQVNQGEKVALLGKNGAGKTTLFKILAGLEDYDKGNKMIRKGATVGLLDQIPKFRPGCTVSDILHLAFDELLALKAQMRQLEERMRLQDDAPVLEQYGKMQQLFETGGGYEIEEKIKRVRAGLKIGAELLDQRFYTLSGGEQTRVTLGKLILEEPDVLLLDEPTNHLDLSSLEWLEELLKNHRGTSIVISHDRYFLDRVVGRVVEIVEGKAQLYAGNYSFFVKEKQARYEGQLARYDQEQKEISRLEKAAAQMHDWAQRADSGALHKRAFNIEKRIERMEKTDRPIREQSLTSHFFEHDFSGQDLILLQDVHKAYGQNRVLKGFDLLVQKAEQLAILGANGSGKSTLLRIIIGAEDADRGKVKIGDSVKSAYLPQIISFDNPSLSILETIRGELRIDEGSARHLLAKFRFRGEDVHKIVANLSGGEKSRLRLCLIMQEEANLLILDEPTNHLDIESREWLEEALAGFAGALLFVSHDRFFINKFATRIVEIADGRPENYRGNYNYYKERKAGQQQELDSGGMGRLGKPKERSPKRVFKQRKSGLRQIELEGAILLLEQELGLIRAQFEVPSVPYPEIVHLYERQQQIEKELEGLLESWIELS